MAGWLDKYNDGGPVQENYNDFSMSAPEGFVGSGTFNKGRDYSPAWGGQFAMGGSMPGAVGFMYARTAGAAPSNGPYAKKTKASAENGTEMRFYQEGLDWKPKTISEDGSSTDKGEKYVDPEHSLQQRTKGNKFLQGAIDAVSYVFDDLPKQIGNAVMAPITPFMYNNLSENDKKELFKKYRPIDYPGIFSAIGTTLHNTFSSEGPKPVRLDDKGNLAIEEEAWSKALGLPTKANYIQESKYRPTSAKDPNAKYYTLHPNVIDKQKIIDYVQSGEWEKNKKLSKNKKDYYAQMSSFAPFMKDEWKNRQDLGDKEIEDIDPIQRFQMFKGYDPKKKKNYISISDTYDFDFAPAQKVIKPFEIYDRIYYEDGGQLAKLDQLTNFTNYNTKQPGGWLDKYEG